MTKDTMPTDNGFRFQSDVRQVGGLLMLMSFCCMVAPLGFISHSLTPNGAVNDDPDETPLWQLIGSFCVFLFGFMGIYVGYMATVHDYSHKNVNVLLMVFMQTFWIPFITEMIVMGKGSRDDPEENIFIPVAYEPTGNDIRFAGAMGVLGVIFYSISFFGSMAFMLWYLHGFTIDKPLERDGTYFKTRLMWFSTVLFLAGLVQFIVGCWAEHRFNVDAADIGPITIGFFVMSFPGIAIWVGLLQMFNGFWGMSRSNGNWLCEESPSLFQHSLGFQWLNVVILQIICQITYLGGVQGVMAAYLVPFWVTVALGLTLMPAYLDHKANTLPETFPEDHYGGQVVVQEQARDGENA